MTPSTTDRQQNLPPAADADVRSSPVAQTAKAGQPDTVGQPEAVEQTESASRSGGDNRSSDPPRSRTARIVRGALRWSWRGFKWLLLLAMMYASALAIGLIPVNRDFQPTPDGVEIFVFSDGLHADLILPTTNDVTDWRKHFRPDHFKSSYATTGSHVQIGWGEKNFYLHTPTWDDLKASTAAQALLIPSPTVMHVGFTGPPLPEWQPRRLVISREQYRQLVDYIQQTFVTQDGAYVPIEGYSFTPYDAFYEAQGSYHLCQTCNNWSGNALKQAGVKTGCWTPFAYMVLFHLPPPETAEPADESAP